MPRSVCRRWILSGVVVCAALAGPIAVAQASDNDLRATLNTYAPKIVKDENAVKKGFTQYPKGKPKPLERALKHVPKELAGNDYIKGIQGVVKQFVDRILAGDSPFRADFLDFQRTVARYGAVNGLSQLLLKIASPGVPAVKPS